MRCPECNGRGHFLMPLTTPSCDDCDGTGQLTGEQMLDAVLPTKLLADLGKLIASTGKVTVSSTPGTLPWFHVHPQPARGLSERVPEPPRAQLDRPGPLLQPEALFFGKRGGKTRRAEVMRENEFRLHETVAGHVAAEHGCEVTAHWWNNAEDRLVIRPRDGKDIYVSAETIRSSYRATYLQDGGALQMVEARDRVTWHVLRVFEEAP